MARSWATKEYCTKSQLRKFLGKLFHICQCCPTLRLFVNRLLETLRSSPDMDATPLALHLKLTSTGYRNISRYITGSKWSHATPPWTHPYQWTVASQAEVVISGSHLLYRIPRIHFATSPQYQRTRDAKRSDCHQALGTSVVQSCCASPMWQLGRSFGPPIGPRSCLLPVVVCTWGMGLHGPIQVRNPCGTHSGIPKHFGRPAQPLSQWRVLPCPGWWVCCFHKSHTAPCGRLFIQIIPTFSGFLITLHSFNLFAKSMILIDILSDILLCLCILQWI